MQRKVIKLKDWDIDTFKDGKIMVSNKELSVFIHGDEITIFMSILHVRRDGLNNVSICIGNKEDIEIINKLVKELLKQKVD